MIPVKKAYEIICKVFSKTNFPVKNIPLTPNLSGILQEEIKAPQYSPSFDKAMMDGISIDYKSYKDGIKEFPIVAYQAAGEAPKKINLANEAIEIATGAPLPQGTNCVIPYEDIIIHESKIKKNDMPTSSARIKSKIKTILPMANVQPIGKEYKLNDILFSKNLDNYGSFLSAKHMSVLASIGKKKIKVNQTPSVGVIVTGDELVAIDQTPKPWQIRASNGIMIKSFLNEWGFDRVETIQIADDITLLTKKIKSFITKKDWVLITGSLSKGKHDFVPIILDKIKATIEFYRVKQKPGKPFLFATKKAKKTKMIFGLPGNPVSSLVCLRRYILPAYLETISKPINTKSKKMFQFKLKVKPSNKFKKINKNLTFFPLVTWNRNDSGTATFSRQHGSGDFFSLVNSDGFIEIPANHSITEKKLITFFPWKPI